MLQRDDGHYASTPETDHFLDRAKPSYIGGLLEMTNTRLYGFWGHLTEALRTGRPQNESKTDPSANLFDALYRNPVRLRLFLQGMTGLSLGTAKAIAQRFPWRDYQTFLDVGGRRSVSDQISEPKSALMRTAWHRIPQLRLVSEVPRAAGPQPGTV